MKPTSKSQSYPNHIYGAPRCNPRPVCLTSCLSLCWDCTFRGGFQTSFRLCSLGQWVTGLLYFVVVLVFVLSISTFSYQFVVWSTVNCPLLKVYHLISFNIHICETIPAIIINISIIPQQLLCLFLTCLSLYLHTITDLLSFSPDEAAFSRNLCRTYTVRVPFAWCCFFFFLSFLLSMMIWRFIHFLCVSMACSFVLLSSFPVHIIICLVYSPVERHLSCF